MTMNRRLFLRRMLVAAGCATIVPTLPAAASAILPDTQTRTSRTRTLMGTFVSITVVGSSRRRAEDAIEAVFAEMEGTVRTFDHRDPASPLAALNEHSVLRGAPQELVEVLLRTKHHHQLTGGAFDATVGPVMDLLARMGARAFADHKLVEEALQLVDGDGVAISPQSVRLNRQGMAVTLDGAAKGFIVDKASETLTKLGVVNHLVNAGGDIRVSGDESLPRPWVLAVQDPESSATLPGRISLTNGAVATSGGYEISFDADQTHHHIVNPRTGLSPQRVRSVTVCAKTVLDADALSTAAFVLPPRAAFQLIDSLPRTDAFLLTAEGTPIATRNFPWAEPRG